MELGFFWIPKPRIPDSASNNFPKFRDSFTWDKFCIIICVNLPTSLVGLPTSLVLWCTVFSEKMTN